MPDDQVAVPRRGLAARLKGCFREGAVAGGRQALWLLALMIPVSLAVKLLAMTGALAWLARLLEPAMRLAGLPGGAALAAVTAALLQIYSGIAALSAIPLNGREVTILAFIMLSFHNLPVEVAVQKKAGSSAWRILLLRLAAAAGGALALNLVMPADGGPAILRGGGRAEQTWLAATAWLVGKVIVLVVGLMILQRLIREFGVAGLLARALYPLLWLLGLPRSTAFLWITANTLGLAYGGAVLIEESRSGALSRRDVELLNRSIAVCHSLLEDTILFAAIGALALWITLPRLVLAAAAVWGYRLWARVAQSAQSPSTSVMV